MSTPGPTTAGSAREAAREVHDALRAEGGSVAVAESLTGGLLAAELVDVPGASRTFRGSVTAYATDLKASVLGVDAGLLAAEGPVHPAVAVQMAQGVRRLMGAAYGVATTGVAGPDPQDGKPVGTVYVAVAGPGGTAVSCPRLTGGRATIRRKAVAAALELLREQLGLLPGGGVCATGERVTSGRISGKNPDSEPEQVEQNPTGVGTEPVNTGNNRGGAVLAAESEHDHGPAT